MDYMDYQRRLEQEYGAPIEQIIRTVYIDQDLGPATGAKALGIPRQAFLHFVHQCDLKKEKLQHL
jgi:hypothetical protein